MSHNPICPLCQGHKAVRLFDALDNVKVITMGLTRVVSIPEGKQGKVVNCPHCEGAGRVERNRLIIPNSSLN